MASCGANVGTLPAAPRDERPISEMEMQYLVDSLRSILEIADSTSSSSSGTLDLLRYFQGHTAEGNRFRTGIEDLRSLTRKAQWNEFLNFMKLRAQERPYPTYLYRAHVHGHPFPRFEDDCSGQYADTFGSDHHLWVEFDARSEIPMPTSEATEHWTVHDVLEELREHLNKTQNNLQRQMSGEEPYWSRLVSLSGDFRWTTQRICKTGRLATEGLQIPGLAIFETSVVKREVHIWRVQDMFDFLDSRTKGTVIFSRDLRRWVANADEYVCWALVPKEALISFIPLPNLTQQFGSGDEIFLRKDFVFSTYLSDFHRQPLEKLSFAEYIRRLSGFMSEVIGNISSWTKIEELDVGALGYPFLNPSQWGYDVAAFGQDLDDKVTSTIDAALEKARTREYAADYAYEVETVVD